MRNLYYTNVLNGLNKMSETNRKAKKRIYAERCIKCELGYMIHTKLYTWLCSRCGYQYEIDPNAPYNKSSIKESMIKVD